MSLTRVHYPYAIQLPSPVLTHLTNVSANMGYQTVVQSVAGATAPCFVGVNPPSPVISFDTTDLKSILDLVDIDALAKDLTAGTVSFWYRAGKAMAMREASATLVHVKADMATSAMLLWDQISATNSPGQPATMSTRLLLAKRGATDPLVWTGSQALPAISQACQPLYALGPVKINTVLQTGVTGWTWDNNVELEEILTDGESSMSYRGIRSYHPQVQMQSNELSAMTGATYGGDELTTVELFLKKLSRTGVFVPDATAEHIKITLSGGLKTVDQVSQTPGQVQTTFYAENDGSAFVTVNTASIIS